MKTRRCLTDGLNCVHDPTSVDIHPSGLPLLSVRQLQEPFTTCTLECAFPHTLHPCSGYDARSSLRLKSKFARYGRLYSFSSFAVALTSAGNRSGGGGGGGGGGDRALPPSPACSFNFIGTAMGAPAGRREIVPGGRTACCARWARASPSNSGLARRTACPAPSSACASGRTSPSSRFRLPAATGAACEHAACHARRLDARPGRVAVCCAWARRATG